MKKSLLVCALLGLGATSVQAQSRMVLYEEFTGENCPSCSSANPGLDAMMTSSTNAGKVYMIKYMCNIPSSGPFYYMTNTLFETGRQSFYSVPFAPFGTLDGTIPDAGTAYPGFSAYLTQSDVDSAIAKPTSFKINASYQYNSAYDSITITVHIKAVTAYSKSGANLKLRSALCKTLQFTSSPGTNGETDFLNTVRGMYPDYNGLTIQNSWAAGDSQTYVVKGAVMSEASTTIPHTASDTSVVVWIQNNTGKFIEQTAIAVSAGRLNVNEVRNTVSGLKVYPNPAQGVAHLACNSEKTANGEIRVYSYNGALLKTISGVVVKSGQNVFDIPTTDLAAGVYDVQFEVSGSIEHISLSVAR